MRTSYKLPPKIKRKIKDKTPHRTVSESSGRRCGDFSGWDVTSIAYDKIVIFIQYGLSGYKDILKATLKPIINMQEVAFKIIPFTFGLDNMPFYHGTPIDMKYLAHPSDTSDIVKKLLNLSGNQTSQNPAVISKLFPEKTDAIKNFRGITRIKKKEDLMIVFGRKGEVFFDEALKEKVEKLKKQILFVEIDDEDVNWYFYNYQPEYKKQTTYGGME